MAKQYEARVQHKIDTWENWNKAENFIPLKGELIIYTTNEDGDLETKIKIGDGITFIKALPFIIPDIDSEIKEGSKNLITSDAVYSSLSKTSQIQLITWEADD